MTKKHSGYTPQVRKIHPTGESGQTPEITKTPMDYSKLFELFELNQANAGEDVDTLPGVMVLRNLVAVRNPNTDLDDEDLRIAALTTAKSIHLAIDGYQDKGFNIARDRNALSGAGRSKLSQLGAQMRLQFEGFSSLRPLEQLSCIAEMNIFDLLISKSFVVDSINYNDDELRDMAQSLFGTGDEQLAEDNKELIEKYAAQKARLYDKASLDPSGVKNEVHRQLMAINTVEVRSFVDSEFEKYETDWFSWYENDTTTPDNDTELFAGQEVDFEILPRGTSIREYTEAIYDRLHDSEKALVDLDRVSALEKIRDFMGRDRCYYVHGKQTGKSMPDESGQQVNEDYIGLVIQHFDNHGIVTGEDAITVSPIANKHAGYLFRHDFSQGTSWRETLSKSKIEAKAEGARPLKFTSVTGKDKYEAFLQKALELLTCPPNQFSSDYDLSLKGNGEYKMRRRTDRTLGELALRISSL